MTAKTVDQTSLGLHVIVKEPHSNLGLLPSVLQECIAKDQLARRHTQGSCCFRSKSSQGNRVRVSWPLAYDGIRLDSTQDGVRELVGLDFLLIDLTVRIELDRIL